MGQPIPSHVGILEPEYIGLQSETGGSETSQVPRGIESDCDSPSSGERTGNSLNHPACGMGLRDLNVRLGGIAE